MVSLLTGDLLYEFECIQLNVVEEATVEGV